MKLRASQVNSVYLASSKSHYIARTEYKRGFRKGFLLGFIVSLIGLTGLSWVGLL